MFGAETDEQTTWMSSDSGAALLPTSDQTAATTAPAPSAMPPPAAMPAPAPQMAPSPMTDAAARRGAGTAVLLAGAGLAAGWIVGGPWGAGAGFILIGAARNGWRAKELWPSAQAGDREEAAKSATMAVVGGVIGGYLAYRAMRGPRSTE
jgi:hypothetical protein